MKIRSEVEGSNKPLINNRSHNYAGSTMTPMTYWKWLAGSDRNEQVIYNMECFFRKKVQSLKFLSAEKKNIFFFSFYLEKRIAVQTCLVFTWLHGK
jgi:hypothetical protein